MAEGKDGLDVERGLAELRGASFIQEQRLKAEEAAAVKAAAAKKKKAA